MARGSITTAGGACRALTVAVGIAVVALGFYSHFQSAWVKTIIKIIGIGELKPYKFCEIRENDKCPHIALERFYIAVILATFLVSLFGLILSNLMDMRNACCKIFDVGYHVLAAIALFVGAAAYIVSTERINELVMPIDTSKLNFRRTEKLVAGGLTVFQGVLYIVTAIALGRS